MDDPDATFTVFAPTDDAFDLLGAETINALLADTDTLSDILLYHVVGRAAIDATTALGAVGATAEMASGASVALFLNEGELFVNLSVVTQTDIKADNGIVHVIDSVIGAADALPKSDDTITDIAVAAGSFNTLVTALELTGLGQVLADSDCTFTVFAPTDDAFAKIPADTLNGLIADVPASTAVLTQHVIAGAAVDVLTTFTLNGQSADTVTVSGEDVSIEIKDSALFIQDSKVIITDLYTSNGIIHVIDTVITETL